jgi:hypothetical protein
VVLGETAPDGRREDGPAAIARVVDDQRDLGLRKGPAGGRRQREPHEVQERSMSRGKSTAHRCGGVYGQWLKQSLHW